MQSFGSVSCNWNDIWVLIHERNKMTSTVIWKGTGKIQISSWHLLCLMSNRILLSTKSFAAREEFANNTQNWLNKSFRNENILFLNFNRWYWSNMAFRYSLTAHAVFVLKLTLRKSKSVLESFIFHVLKLAQIIMKTIQCYASWRFREQAIYQMTHFPDV